MARIAVITPVGPDDAGYLTGLVDSLRRQSLTDWQLVLAEDGPTSAARHWADTDPRIEWCNSATRNGPAAARNLASTRLAADLWRNLDADDELADEHVLARTVEVFDREDVGYVVGPLLDLAEDGSAATFADPLPPGPIEPGVLYRGWVAGGGRGLVHPTSMAIRTEVFRRFGGYPALPSSEDTALLLRVAQHERGWFLEHPVGRHRKRAASLSATAAHLDPAARAARHRFIDSLCGPGDSAVRDVSRPR